MWKWILGVPAGLFVLMMVIGSMPQSPETKQRWSNEEAIKLCWENQAKKSNTPDEARFIAGACEKMEADYKAKYGRKP